MTRTTPGHARVDAGFYATLLGATFLMGSSFIAGKILLGHGVPAILLVGWRFLLASLATLPLLAMARVPLRAQLWPAAMAPRQAWTVALIGLLQTAAVMGLLFVGCAASRRRPRRSCCSATRSGWPCWGGCSCTNRWGRCAWWGCCWACWAWRWRSGLARC
jgi:hypothetical protein